MNLDSDLPSWKTTALGTAGFAVIMIAHQQVAIRLFTGAWGGQPDDPLWVGPATAAIGMAAAITWTLLCTGITEPRRREAGRRTGCSHVAAVPVESVVTGEVLALLCPTCDVQLPVMGEEVRP